MIRWPLFIGVWCLLCSPVIGQELPLSHQLLQMQEPAKPDSTTSLVGEEVPEAGVDQVAMDTVATDYVAPDAGAPGSQREEGVMEGRPRRDRRSATRLGIGIPLGMFTGVWISF